MAYRRQGLSQRRRAVGLTQESLAEQLGVERSTIVRWEAGDTEPLPSIRPGLARALDVSMDHLAALLAESVNTDSVWAPARAAAEVVTPTEPPAPVAEPVVAGELVTSEKPASSQVPEVGSQASQPASSGVGLNQLAELLGALRSGALSRDEFDARWPATEPVPGPPTAPVPVTARMNGIAGPGLAESADTAVFDRPMVAIPREAGAAAGGWSGSSSARSTWLAAAGVFAIVLAAGALSVPLWASHPGVAPPAAAGPAVPVDPVPTIPAPDPGSDNPAGAGSPADSPPVPAAPAGGPEPAPEAVPNPAAEVPAPPPVAAAPTPPAVRSIGRSRAASRPNPPAEVKSPARPNREDWEKVAEQTRQRLENARQQRAQQKEQQEEEKEYMRERFYNDRY